MTGIFSEHCLEHFSLPTVLSLLQEFRRIITREGTVRIVVPDAELYLRTYMNQLSGDGRAQFPFRDGEDYKGISTPLLSVNRVFYQDRDSRFGHRLMHDFHLLEALLRKSGFEWVERREFGGGRDPLLVIDSPPRRVESLYIEAGVC